MLSRRSRIAKAIHRRVRANSSIKGLASQVAQALSAMGVDGRQLSGIRDFILWAENKAEQGDMGAALGFLDDAVMDYLPQIQRRMKGVDLTSVEATIQQGIQTLTQQATAQQPQQPQQQVQSPPPLQNIQQPQQPQQPVDPRWQPPEQGQSAPAYASRRRRRRR